MKKYFCLILSVLLVLGFSVRSEGARVYTSDVEKEGVSFTESLEKEVDAAQESQKCDVSIYSASAVSLISHFVDGEDSSEIHSLLFFEHIFNHSPPLS
jgi:hypothetical protein